MKLEKRNFNTEFKVELRTTGALAKLPVLSGYAAKFNTLSEPMPIMQDGEQIGMFREMLLPGCFGSAISSSDVRALINHEPSMILGRNKSGTLRLSEDSVGLHFENDIPDTSYARDLQVSCARGDISQCSFGFSVAPGGDSYSKDTMNPGWYVRSINNVGKLYDVSPVTYPAYVDTDCAVRSLIEIISTDKVDFEKRVAAGIEEQRVAEELRKTEEAETARLDEEKRASEEVIKLEAEATTLEETRNLEMEVEIQRLRLLELF